MHWLQKHKIKQAVKSNLTGQALIELDLGQESGHILCII